MGVTVPSDDPWQAAGARAWGGGLAAFARHYLEAAVILAGGIALAAVLYGGISNYFFNEKLQRVQVPMENLGRELADFFGELSVDVQTVSAFFNASPNVGRREFTSFVRQLPEANLDIHALAWSPLVDGAQREEFVRRARNDGVGNFQILEFNSSNVLVAAAARPLYMPIIYIEPVVGNEAAIGFDTLSNPTLAQAVERARAAAHTAVSSRVLLAQGEAGVVMYAPVYARQPLGNDGEARGEDELLGTVASIIRIGPALERGVGEFRASIGIDVYLYDLGAAPSEQLLYFRPAPESPGRAPRPTEEVLDGGTHLVDFLMGDRAWAVALQPVTSPLGPYERAAPSAAAGAMLLLAVLLGAGLTAARSRAREVEDRVQVRTRELRESEEQIRLLANSLPAMITYIDHDLRYRFANATTERWLSRKSNTIVGFPLEAVLAPPAFAAARPALDAALAGKTVNTTGQVEYPDGRTRDVDSIYVPHIDDSGHVLGIFALAVDVSERRRLERELEDFFNLSASPLAIGDFQGRFRKTNAAWAHLLGYSEDEFVELESDELFFAEDRERAAQVLRDLARGKRIVGEETRMRHKDGSVRIVAWSSTRAPDERRIYISAVDITERRKQEEEVHDARNQALAAARAKSDFLANISHEIRTPLNAVIGFSDLSLKTELSPRQRDYVRKIKSAGQVLLDLISNVLDLSKIESGRLELESAAFDLVEVLETVASIVAVKAAEKELDVFVSAAPDVPLWVTGDSARLTQVLVNLLGNAIKFTTDGAVLVRVTRENAAEVRFGITDTGIGLSAEQRARLFKPFVQADASTTRRFGGTGLGLAISRQIVEAMGGTIGVESEVGHGSTFWFTVPLPAAAGAPPEPAPVAGWRVLVADPSDARRRHLVAALTARGVAVTQATSAAQVTDMLTKTKFDGAVLDGALGTALGAHVAHGGALRSLVLLVAPGELAAGEATHAEKLAVLTKPVNSVQLQRALFGSRRATPVTPASMPLHGLRVLLVEDSALNQEVAVSMLKGAGAAVDVANNGREALEAVGDAAGRYDALLMDVQMPEMDGVAATQALRVDHRPAELPIIAMTAHAFADERARCLAAGMNDYLTKPITEAALTATLLRWTRGTAAGVAAAQAPAAPAAHRLPDRLPGIALHAAMTEFNFSEALLKDLLEKFHDQYMAFPIALDSAWQARNLTELTRLAHSMKGSASYIGATESAAHAEALESALRAGGTDDASLGMLITKLRAAVSTVLTSIDQTTSDAASP